MAHCKKCGRELRPGEGYEPKTIVLEDQGGLLCEQCHKSDVGVGDWIVFFLKFVGCTVLGGIGSLPVILPIETLMQTLIKNDCLQACEVIFPFCKNIVFAYAIAAIVLFVVCKIYAKFRRKSGWFVRTLVKIIGFSALCTGLLSGYLAIFDESYLRELWKIDKTEAVNNAEGVTNGVESVSIDAEVRDVAPVTANEAAQ